MCQSSLGKNQKLYISFNTAQLKTMKMYLQNCILTRWYDTCAVTKCVELELETNRMQNGFQVWSNSLRAAVKYNINCASSGAASQNMNYTSIPMLFIQESKSEHRKSISQYIANRK